MDSHSLIQSILPRSFHASDTRVCKVRLNDSRDLGEGNSCGIDKDLVVTYGGRGKRIFRSFGLYDLYGRVRLLILLDGTIAIDRTVYYKTLRHSVFGVRWGDLSCDLGLDFGVF